MDSDTSTDRSAVGNASGSGQEVSLGTVAPPTLIAADPLRSHENPARRQMLPKPSALTEPTGERRANVESAIVGLLLAALVAGLVYTWKAASAPVYVFLASCTGFGLVDRAIYLMNLRYRSKDEERIYRPNSSLWALGATLGIGTTIIRMFDRVVSSFPTTPSDGMYPFWHSLSLLVAVTSVLAALVWAIVSISKID